MMKSLTFSCMTCKKLSLVVLWLLPFTAMGAMGCSSMKYEIVPDERLNWYHDQAHTLEFRVFQMEKKQDSELSGTWENICSDEYGQVVILGDPLFKGTVYPGSAIKNKTGKEKRAKYLGVVACYYEPSGRPPRTSAVVPLPGRFSSIFGSPTTVIHLGPSQIIKITRTRAFGKEEPLLQMPIDARGDKKP